MSSTLPVPPAEQRRHAGDSSGSAADSAKCPTPGTRTPEKKPRRTSLQVLLPKLPSSESVNHTPVSPSPSLLTPISGEHSRMSESFASSDKVLSPNTGAKLTRKESYKAQRKSYRQEKKRVADELLNSLKDPSVIVLADWLKVRGTLKSWTKLWCILKPGLLLLYKTPKIKSNQWVGTVLLTACQVIERPSKKDGFCFKVFHPLEQSIWAPRGPEKETIGAVVQPLPTSYLIFRAPSQAAGKCWLDALELSLRCSSLLVRSKSRPGAGLDLTDHDREEAANHDTHDPHWSEADFEKHFVDHADLSLVLERFSPETPPTPQRKLIALAVSRLNTPSPTPYPQCSTPCPSPNPVFQNLFRAVAHLERELPTSYVSLELPALTSTDSDAGGGDQEHGSVSETESEASARGDDCTEVAEKEDPPETQYALREEGEIGSPGEQVEELAEEHKSLIWYLVKQVRPGMDLSKVVLPTFILEPRSFLDKLSDSYYHADILSKAVLEDDAFTRMKTVVQWYLSGFYKKPKGLKKPYNPILGETFRCYWKHPSGSRTFYIAEQVSHHPPISAFYVTNRQDGFSLSGSILAKSKFYGNSTSAILDGVATLTLLPRGEEYSITIPYALCKGILMGTLTMELGGKVAIECEKTGYKTELEFKLKPFIGGADHINGVSGKLKLGKETLATIDGYWDGVINIKDKRTEEELVLWSPTPSVRSNRLKRYTVPVDQQGEFESERLWSKVSQAIFTDDQVAATDEKTILENAQRLAAKTRKDSNSDWHPKHFEQSVISDSWVYKHCDLRPWDPRNDQVQFEYNYVVCTKTRHETPMIRTASIVSVDPPQVQPLLQTESRSSLSVLKSSKRRMTSQAKRQESISSSQDGEAHSDSSQWEDTNSAVMKESDARVLETVKCLEQVVRANSERLLKLQHSLEMVARAQRERDKALDRRLGSGWRPDMLLVVGVISVLQMLVCWFLLRPH